MANKVKRLSARFVDTIGKPGRYADGHGLYLIVSPTGAKRWQLLFRWRDKLKEMGLGSQSGVSLLEARVKATEARSVLRAVATLSKSAAHPVMPTRPLRPLAKWPMTLLPVSPLVFVTKSTGLSGRRLCGSMRPRSGISRLPRLKLPTFSRSYDLSGTPRTKPPPGYEAALSGSRTLPPPTICGQATIPPGGEAIFLLG